MSYRVLSSAQTFWIKVIWPIFMILGTIVLFALLEFRLLPDLYRSLFPVPLTPRLKDIFWAIWIICFVITFWWGFQLKRIAVDGESIYISNYLQEVKLPLSAIIEVRENIWLKMHPITLDLGQDTPWGTTIKFMPTIRFVMPNWVSHPVVAELRDMAYWAKAGKRMEQQLRS
jgi:hypothetical protein